MLRGAAGHGEDLAREILTLGLGLALPFEILRWAGVWLRRGGHVDLLLRGALYPPADTGIIPGRGRAFLARWPLPARLAAAPPPARRVQGDSEEQHAAG